MRFRKTREQLWCHKIRCLWMMKLRSGPGRRTARPVLSSKCHRVVLECGRLLTGACTWIRTLRGHHRKSNCLRCSCSGSWEAWSWLPACARRRRSGTTKGPDVLACGAPDRRLVMEKRTGSISGSRGLLRTPTEQSQAVRLLTETWSGLLRVSSSF